MNNENKRGRKTKDIDRNNIFAVRLRKLIEETESKQQDVADNIGVSRQALNKWVNGETVPDIFSAAKIADYFDVSTDYMTGRTDIKSKNEDIQTACKVTSLSEKAINNITSFKLEYDFPVVLHEIILKLVMNSVTDEVGFICEFLESDEFSNFFSTLGKAVINKVADYIESEIFSETSTWRLTNKLIKEINYNGHYFEISKAYTIDLYNILNKFIDNYVKEFQEDFQKKIHNNSDAKEREENAQHNPEEE